MRDPEIQVIVHPECIFDVVQHSDYAGSTNYIIRTIEEAPAGSKWAIGTEMVWLIESSPNILTNKLNRLTFIIHV